MRTLPLILTLFSLGACRADVGEPCVEDADCIIELACHERTCKTRQEIARITMARREAAWRAKKRAIFDQVGELQEQLAELESRLAEAESEAEREILRRQLESLRKAGRAPEPKLPRIGEEIAPPVGE